MARSKLILVAGYVVIAAGISAGAEQKNVDQYGELVQFGQRIFVDTPRHAGRYVGNKLSCANCHLGAGTRANAAPMWAAFTSYPAYQAKFDRVVTLEDRIAQCFRFSENGFAPTRDSQVMLALLAYMRSISQGKVVGNGEGRGFPTIIRPAQGPSPRNGQAVYAQRCAICHGPNGGGAGAIPPLWGMQSFSRGAGFNQNDVLAGFIHAYMPPSGPALTPKEAWDVAAWINRQVRPPDPRKGLRGWLE